MKSVRILFFFVMLAESQVLPLPERSPALPEGREFCPIIASLPRQEREDTIFAHVLRGNIPSFLRTLVPVTVYAVIGGTEYTLTYSVTPDYLSIGSDHDYFLMPMTPLLAQKIADATACILPTPRMVDQIYSASPVHLRPQPIPPDAAMDKVPRFFQHNDSVQSLRMPLMGTFPLGSLVAGTKKDVVLDTKIYSRKKTKVPRPVVIYGWHQLNGVPIQPAYNGHGETYADYSHGIRLVRKTAVMNGCDISLTDILGDPVFSSMVSDTVLARPYYPPPLE